jgi:hypothetical protein
VALDPSGGVYDCGTEVTLTATPNGDRTFLHWRGMPASYDPNNPETILVDANKPVTAVFSDPTDANISSSEWRTDAVQYESNEDEWTFTGQAGDLVVIQVNRTSGALNPIIDLFPPSGPPKETGTGGSYNDSHTIAFLSAHSLAQSGQYKIRVRDQGSNEIGDYVLSLLNFSGPLTSWQDPDGGPIQFEEVKTGAIDPVTDQDAYTFMGTAGEIVSIQANRTDGDLNPVIELYPPSGLPRETWTGESYNDSHEIAYLGAHALAETGQYTILLRDQGGNDAGGYIMSLHSIPVSSTEPNEPNQIGSSEWVAASIDSVVDQDTYTFTGQEGDLVFVQANRTSGALNPIIELYPPSGLPRETWTGESYNDSHTVA